MMGMRLSSMNLRVVSRTRRSSSVSKESNSRKSTPRNLMAISFSFLFGGGELGRHSGVGTLEGNKAEGSASNVIRAGRTLLSAAVEVDLGFELGAAWGQKTQLFMHNRRVQVNGGGQECPPYTGAGSVWAGFYNFF